jgi:hypothetical protein
MATHCKYCGDIIEGAYKTREVCNHCASEKSHAWQKKTHYVWKGKPPNTTCPKCKEKHFRKDAGEYRFCKKCEDEIINCEIPDSASQECRILG